jgi:CubicO group peptidase (beta-lactamase class C family)
MSPTTALVATALALVAVAAGALAWLKYRLDHARDRHNLASAIDAQARKFLAQGLAPALVVGVYKDGRSHVKGYGSLTPGADVPPDDDTVFQIASVSKLFTASLLQRLCDQGVLRLDATLGELIGGRWPLAPRVRAVTLRQLATHTSGLPSIPRSLQAEAASRAAGQPALADPYNHLGPEHVFHYLATAPDQGRSGRFNYANLGMGLLGHVFEHVLGQDLETLAVNTLFGPLGMPDTRITVTPELAARLAPGHDARNQPAGLWHFKALAGAGAFASTGHDLLRFIRASVEPDAPAAQAFQAMRMPQFGGRTGLGWMQPGLLDRFLGNRGIVWHNGMVGGYAAYLSIDAGTRSGTVVLVNRSVDVTLLGMLLTRQVRTQSWSPPGTAG